MAYQGSVELISGITPKNNGSFPLVHAKDVYVDDSTRLDNKLAAIQNGIENLDLSDYVTTEYAEATYYKKSDNPGTADLSAYAPLASPTFTGTPKAPTASSSTNNTQIATTAFVKTVASNYVTSAYAEETYLKKTDSPSTPDLSTYAPLASPAFTGTPTAPTAASSANNTQVATTAFVKTALGSYAPKASPAFTGMPTAPTAAVSTDSTQLATTAFVKSVLRNIDYLSSTDAASTYVAKEAGKGLSTNDFTDAYKDQLDDSVPREVQLTLSSTSLTYSDASITDNTYCVFQDIDTTKLTSALTWDTATGVLTIETATAPSESLTFTVVMMEMVGNVVPYLDGSNAIGNIHIRKAIITIPSGSTQYSYSSSWISADTICYAHSLADSGIGVGISWAFSAGIVTFTLDSSLDTSVTFDFYMLKRIENAESDEPELDITNESANENSVTLPSGLVIKSIRVTINARDTSYDWTFATPFPTACFFALGSCSQENFAYLSNIAVSSWSKTAVHAYQNNAPIGGTTSNSVSMAVTLVAFGY